MTKTNSVLITSSQKTTELSNFTPDLHIQRKTITMKLFIPFLFVFLAFKATSQNYFQQEVNYDINVALDDKLHELNADITMEYTNNSPDALNFIWMHLWPNAYKNGKTALAKQQ